MNVSREWLQAFFTREFSAAELRELLTRHTATVDELVPLRQDLAPIVVARVVEAGRHPDSDHLWLTKVDAGGKEPLEVVCGAPNVTAGSMYPFAPVGTTMPNGMKIERRKIRGIASNGMLCSARELGLGDDHQGILELNLDVPTGTPLLSAMPIGDTRLVLDIGANRPDLLSHQGVAREVAAVTGEKLRLPEIDGLAAPIPPARTASDQGTTAGVSVTVDAATRTRRYMGAVVKGITVGPSPEWLSRRLEAVGLRSINNIVDATNYVLHELGQPVHAFDLAKLGPKVVVRAARKGEKLVTLDGTTRELPADAVVIAGADAAHAVAGVMGGRDSEVTDATKDLFIEVASFDPALTRAARRKLGLSTDASYRFERGVDPELAVTALDRVVRLVITLAGGALADAPVDVMGSRAESRALTLRIARIAQVLGERLDPSAVRRHLEGAGFTVVSSDAAQLGVRVPSWRADVVDEIDLVEEVARFHGYDNFPAEIRPYRPTTTFDDRLWTTADRVRTALVGQGLLEARPMPFVAGDDATHVRVANPLAENEAHLRVSLLETLARRAEFNLAQRSGDIRLFEVGSAFTAGGGPQPTEDVRVGILVMGRRRPPHFTESTPPAVDEWDARNLAEVAAAAIRPGAAIDLLPATGALWDVRADGESLGTVRQLTLDAPVWASPAFGIELRLGAMDDAPPAPRGQHSYKEGRPGAIRVGQRYRPLPTMPPAEFDLALLVPKSMAAADVERVIRAAAGELLERLDLFDLYTGQGVDEQHRSLAWRLTFRHPERTLRDKEIDGRRARILSALQQELNVRQRSA
ncbi:MAG TPA: phenylalanine--tRNA ligase subunit beta [Gemmatimonadaceae bacterium]|nr:phenylalanine--tRNA ligase subunit beta [Gemmatimonadaceae bacterium]